MRSATARRAEGENLSVIGNTNDYRSDGQKAALEGMTLSTRQEVGDKLYELFRVNLPDLKNEADQVCRCPCRSRRHRNRH